MEITRKSLWILLGFVTILGGGIVFQHAYMYRDVRTLEYLDAVQERDALRRVKEQWQYNHLEMERLARENAEILSRALENDYTLRQQANYIKTLEAELKATRDSAETVVVTAESIVETARGEIARVDTIEYQYAQAVREKDYEITRLRREINRLQQRLEFAQVNK